jgi:acetyl-CoA carboxylase alpha subunit
MNFLDFEKPIADLYAQLDLLIESGQREHVTIEEKKRQLEYDSKERFTAT